MGVESDGGSPSDGDGPRINFDYIKSNHFRAIRPDGVIGTLTPDGLPQLAFFSERQAIPQRIVYRLNEDGTLGEEVDRISREAIVREVEVAVTFDRDTARAVIAALIDLTAKQDEDESEK